MPPTSPLRGFLRRLRLSPSWRCLPDGGLASSLDSMSLQRGINVIGTSGDMLPSEKVIKRAKPTIAA
jgi:hypothetical protein